MLTAQQLCSPHSNCMYSSLTRGPFTEEAQAIWAHNQAVRTHVYVRCKHVTQSYRLVSCGELSSRRSLQ